MVLLITSIIFSEKPRLKHVLLVCFSICIIRLYDTAIKLGKLQSEFKVPVDPEEYARDNLKFGLVEVVYEWAKVYSSSGEFVSKIYAGCRIITLSLVILYQCRGRLLQTYAS